MSNEAPETRERIYFALARLNSHSDRADLVWSWLATAREQRDVEVTGGSHDRALTAGEVKTIFKMSTEFAAALTTAREQGRAEALADVTEGDVDAFEHGWHGALGDWRSVVKTGINHFLASRRRPVAAAGNEEWDRSG